MAPRFETISFLSDYGLVDEFVGVVRSVVRSLAPHVTTIDITHEVPPHDVRAGSLALIRAVQYLAPGVVLAVVDPGVGTSRRAIAVEVADGEAFFVGPDNGLLAPAVAIVGGATRAVELTNDAYHLPAPGATFAGRDVFAPAAAHLCLGVALLDLGAEVDPLSLLPGILPIARAEDDGLAAEVLWVDRYGNAQLNVGPDDLVEAGLASTVADTRDVSGGGREPERIAVHLTSHQITMARTARRVAAFGELGPGELGLVLDSYGLLALAYDRRSAAEELGLAAGSGVRLAAPR